MTTIEVPTSRTAAVDVRRRRLPRWAAALGVVVAWVVLWAFTRGHDTLVLPGRDQTDLHEWLAGVRDDVLAARDTNPLIQATYRLGSWFADACDWLGRLVAEPARPRPVPQIGWLGVVAVATWVGLALAGWRIALLVGASFLAFGLFGYWDTSLDLLIVTFLAVAVVVVVGLPLAVWSGTSERVRIVLETLLDLMQTLPTFVYLLPIVLLFGIGSSAAVACTIVYALPPLVRIGAHGIRSVSGSAVEATDSTGQSAWQRLVKVQLPMARRTIVVGLNQSIMAALSMATIAAYVNGPGLGEPVLQGLIRLDIGGAFVPGALIVVMAVMLDRTVTAASERAEVVARGGGGSPRTRRTLVGATGVAALVALYLSRQYLWAAEFPETSLRRTVAGWADDVASWVTGTFDGLTGAIKNAISYGLLNPLQDLVADSPWWLAGLAILALALVVGGWRGAAAAVVCLTGIRLLDLWHDAMVTLTMTLVATLLVMVLAVVVGVWMARRPRVDLVLRPVLDAGQTIPPFVYLVPVLALFGPTRFTAIVAGVVYAAPAAIKLVADGISRIDPGALESARSAGATAWQEIVGVQLPMARASLVLAANQGLLYVLAMAVIGGMVGAGALGYDVVLGFSRSEEWGKGAAAGLTIVLLGILLDRITRAAAQRDAA